MQFIKSLREKMCGKKFAMKVQSKFGGLFSGHFLRRLNRYRVPSFPLVDDWSVGPLIPPS